MNHRYKLP